MYVKRMLLINRRNLWQLAAAVALLLLYANSLSVWGFVLGILSIPFVFTMTRAVAVFAYKTTQSARGKLIPLHVLRGLLHGTKLVLPKARSGMTTFTGSLCGKHSVCLMVSSLAAMLCARTSAPKACWIFCGSAVPRSESRRRKKRSLPFCLPFFVSCS